MKKNSHHALAKNVRFLMEHYGLSQTEMAKKSGVSQRTISNMIRPECGISQKLQSIEAIADAFKLETWLLLIDDVNAELIDDRGIDQLMHNYLKVDESARVNICRIAENEVKYIIEKRG